jgi:hypothetical protein
MTIANPEIGLFHVSDFPAPCLGFQQHREGTVLGGLDGAYGIHDDAQASVLLIHLGKIS